MSSFSGIKNTLLASRWTKKLPPPMTQTKNSKAPERYAPGPCCHYLWITVMSFPGPQHLR